MRKLSKSLMSCILAVIMVLTPISATTVFAETTFIESALFTDYGHGGQVSTRMEFEVLDTSIDLEDFFLDILIRGVSEEEFLQITLEKILRTQFEGFADKINIELVHSIMNNQANQFAMET